MAAAILGPLPVGRRGLLAAVLAGPVAVMHVAGCAARKVGDVGDVGDVGEAGDRGEAGGPGEGSRGGAAPDRSGPYPAGYRTYIIAEQSDRPLTTSVWYPAEDVQAQAGAARYPVTERLFTVSRLARAEAPPVSSRFPLVIFSHGSAGSRVQLAFLAELLASHGFVVAAPDHPGDTMIEHAEGRQAELVDLASLRSIDVTSVIDAMTDPRCQLSELVRADNIGIVGFSFGGLTAIVSTVGFLRAPAEPRVKAVVAIAPATEVLPPDLLAGVGVPVLLVGGTRDLAVPVEHHVDPAFEQLTAAHPRMRVTIDDATHNSFTEICDQAALATTNPMPAGLRIRFEVTAETTCRPPAIDIGRAHRITGFYTVAFLARHLRADPAYDRHLGDAAGDAFPEATVRRA